MDYRVWCKTILTVYKFLGTVTASLDKCIRRMACSAGAETQHQAEKIIEYSENKIDLINLKVITEQIFLKIPKESAELLILRYVDNMQNSDIVQLKKMGMRTYFRKLNKAMAAFEKETRVAINEHRDTFEKLIMQKWISLAFE